MNCSITHFLDTAEISLTPTNEIIPSEPKDPFFKLQCDVLEKERTILEMCKMYWKICWTKIGLVALLKLCYGLDLDGLWFHSVYFISMVDIHFFR